MAKITWLNEMIVSQKKRDLLSASFTAAICAILLCVFALIPVKNKKYSEIRIQLTENAPSAEKVVEKIAPVKEEKIAEADVVPAPKPDVKQQKKLDVQKTVEKKAPAAQNSAQKAATPVKPVPVGKSMEERMAENAAKSVSKKTEWNEDMFDDSSEITNSSAVSAPKIPQNSGSDQFSGTAATSSDYTAQSSINNGKNAQNSAVSGSSAATSQALSKIAGTEFSAHGSSENIEYQGSAITASRKPIFTTPIVFSDELEKLIDRNVTVRISMEIDTRGFVIPSSIKILPENSLPPEIEYEIKRQISRWQFESGSNNGQSSFNYSINIE